MPGNTTVSSIPYALLTDSANENTSSQSMASALDHIVIPKYATPTARGTANPTPTNNDICSVTSTDEIMYYNGSVWVSLTPRIYYASSATTVTSSTTLVNVNGLNTVPYEASSIYYMEGFAYFGSVSLTPGCKTNWHTSTTDVTGHINTMGSVGGTSAGDNQLYNGVGGFSSGNLQVSFASIANGIVVFHGTFSTVTAGNISWQIAQSTSSANSISVGVGSCLKITKIG